MKVFIVSLCNAFDDFKEISGEGNACIVDSTAAAKLLETEAQALLKWKDSLQSHSLNSWTSTNSTPCNWFGITCNFGGTSELAVTEINLSGAGLEGNLDALDFSSLPSLVRFNLSMNTLYGTIPPSLGTLSKLTSLSLYLNQFSGSIPLSLANLSLLTKIDLSTNNLTGEISPRFLTSWTKLVSLELQENNLTGAIPSEIGLLSNLRIVRLFENQLNGSIPPEMGDLKNLVELGLYKNDLSGTIPVSLCNLTQLTNFQVPFLKK
ncbi:hypothetical protein QJS04_geneDACA015250 [Acorus gramineus]|uniref:Leucine-rich repeat-containing N-terminal plant-type domain-containing protein n=1 Tax=Acorus gramineus TaxID=55184 RepID=A0AAV9ARD4_ACOGR|nr:hypothetical protein QJS04_geneDACA015250 [Acorus gramineus]